MVLAFALSLLAAAVASPDAERREPATGFEDLPPEVAQASSSASSDAALWSFPSELAVPPPAKNSPADAGPAGWTVASEPAAAKAPVVVAPPPGVTEREVTWVTSPPAPPAAREPMVIRPAAPASAKDPVWSVASAGAAASTSPVAPAVAPARPVAAATSAVAPQAGPSAGVVAAARAPAVDSLAVSAKSPATPHLPSVPAIADPKVPAPPARAAADARLAPEPTVPAAAAPAAPREAAATPAAAPAAAAPVAAPQAGPAPAATPRPHLFAEAAQSFDGGFGTFSLQFAGLAGETVVFSGGGLDVRRGKWHAGAWLRSGGTDTVGVTVGSLRAGADVLAWKFFDVSLGVGLGAGVARLRSVRATDMTGVVLVEPEAAVHVRLMPWLRASAGLSWRVLNAAPWKGPAGDEMAGFAGSLGLEIGSF